LKRVCRKNTGWRLVIDWTELGPELSCLPRASTVALALMVTTCMTGVPEARRRSEQADAEARAQAFGPVRQTCPASRAGQCGAGSRRPAPAPAAPPAACGTSAGQLDHHRGRPAPRADTIRSYIRLREGDRYTQAAADQVLKDLFATELFSDVQVRNNNGAW
jgi:outer membrane protein insertion porin family